MSRATTRFMISSSDSPCCFELGRVVVAVDPGGGGLEASGVHGRGHEDPVAPDDRRRPAAPGHLGRPRDVVGGRPARGQDWRRPRSPRRPPPGTAASGRGSRAARSSPRDRPYRRRRVAGSSCPILTHAPPAPAIPPPAPGGRRGARARAPRTSAGGSRSAGSRKEPSSVHSSSFSSAKARTPVRKSMTRKATKKIAARATSSVVHSSGMRVDVQAARGRRARASRRRAGR